MIVAIDDVKVSTYADLSKIMDSHAIGDMVKVTVVRGEETLDFNVVLQAATSR